MSTAENGPPVIGNTSTKGSENVAPPSLSLRDYFAGQALAGLLAGDAHPDVALEHLMESDNDKRLRAEFSYALADAMLAARGDPDA